MTPEKLKAARQLYDARKHTIADIAAASRRQPSHHLPVARRHGRRPPIDGTAIPTSPLVTRTRAPGHVEERDGLWVAAVFAAHAEPRVVSGFAPDLCGEAHEPADAGLVDRLER